MGSVAETGTTVLLSSHLLADLERVCDYLIVLHAAAGAAARRGRRPARRAPAAGRPAARRRSRSPASRPWSGPATPTGSPRCWSAPTGRSPIRPGRSTTSPWRTWSWPTSPTPAVRARASRAAWGCTGMIWLTWRQHRKQALFTVVGLAVLAAFMVPTGLAMHRRLRRHRPGGLLGAMGAIVDYRPARCRLQRAGRTVQRRVRRMSSGSPCCSSPAAAGRAVLGRAAGRPRGEHGTHRLVWTQGVSRRRWAVVKFGLIVAGAVAARGGVRAGHVVVGHAARPGQRRSRFEYLVFDLQGWSPSATRCSRSRSASSPARSSRRVLPAMAVTLVGFAGVRLAVAFVRSTLRDPPVRARFPSWRKRSPIRCSATGSERTPTTPRAGSSLPAATYSATRPVRSTNRPRRTCTSTNPRTVLLFSSSRRRVRRACRTPAPPRGPSGRAAHHVKVDR